MNSTNNPPIIIMNRRYEYQKLLDIIPDIKAISSAWVINVIPADIGWFIQIKIVDVIINAVKVVEMQRVVY